MNFLRRLFRLRKRRGIVWYIDNAKPGDAKLSEWKDARKKLEKIITRLENQEDPNQIKLDL